MSRNRTDPPEPSSTEPADSPFDDSIVLPIEDAIDLHAFSPRDIPSVVEEYLEQCHQAGFHEVRLIHGRGKGIQRRVVRTLLEKHPEKFPWILSFKDAPAESGGWGATIVQLKRD